MAAVIGALRADLSASVAQFSSDMGKAAKDVQKFGRTAAKVGRDLTNAGRSMSVGLTVPLLAAGAAAIKVSMDFEKAMTEVQISTKASASEMEQLSTQARQIGKDTIFSAIEAAGAMDMLAKAGLDVTTILGGAAKATTDLAAATGSEMEPAANAISDAMAQFGINAAGLPAAVNQITGAVNESKLSFDDFVMASSQAGGVAGALGVSFEDFNATIAATSPLFASGSDAGTSFKTFLTSLVPKSTAAATAMAEYNLAFFNANGSMKDMAVIAEMLKVNLGGLSEEAKNEVLKDIFGTDAMRTAIGLMKEGSAGLTDISAKIRETDAAAQAAKRMEGLAGQLEQMKGSLEELGIAIGDSGLLPFITSMISGLTDFIDRISELNPAILKWVVILGGVVAVVGPILFFLGSMATGIASLITILPLLTGAIGFLWTAILGPVGLVIAAIAAVLVIWHYFGDEIMVGVRVITGLFARLYSAAKQWIADKLAALFRNAAKQVLAFVEPFRKLYVAVVGNSYIPDMVTEVGDWMGQLPKRMGDPTDEAVQRVQEGFANLAEDVSSSLANMTLPEATSQANGFREKLADLSKEAREAGASTTAVAQAVGILNTQIDRFEQAGLSEEAADFARETERLNRQVRDFARGGLPPLAAQLEEVDDKYEALRTRIEDAIDANRVLAQTNAAAAETMLQLEGQLATLADAHRDATEAAKAQYAAEQAIADLQAQREGAGIAGEIADARRENGSAGVETGPQADMRRIQEDLDKSRLDALIKLRQLEADKTAAELAGDTEEAMRVGGLIDLQRELYGVVTETTALQIASAKKVQDAYKTFTDDLSDVLADSVMDWKLDVDGLRSVFKNLARELFIKPGTDAISGALGGLLKGFAGGFAVGGTIPKRGWGIVGENGPEPVFAGSMPMNVFPNESMGGGGGRSIVFNISTPNADSFRMSQRQIGRQAKEALGKS